MTILWIYNMPLVPEAGGTERITSLVAKGLTARGYRCLDILVFSEHDRSMSYRGEPVADLYTFLTENKVDIVINQIAYARWLLEAFLEQGGKRWHQEGGRIVSCLHFDPCNPSYIQLLRSCERLTALQHIILLKHYLLYFYYKHKQQQHEGTAYNYIYDNSDFMVCLSETHFPYLKKVMARNDYSKLRAIGNPLTFPDIAPISITDQKTKTVIVCARMSEYHKRISLILKAWKFVKRNEASRDWKLLVIGDGPDLLRYKRIATETRLEDVEFLGQQSPEPYYRKASMLLLSSSAEGWGLTITEGLQNGVVPVVMNSSSVYGSIVTNHYNGLLTPNNNCQAFAKAILMLMSDSQRLYAMQLNALESAKRFILGATMEKWEELLKA